MSGVGVVVVHYEDPVSLGHVLAALETACPDAVVVADDGSARLPDPGTRPYPVRVVTQEDRGFRAAAARNLGVRALLAQRPDLDVLLLLDGDTIPTPGYVPAMTAAVRETATHAPHRRALVVGRRRYADLHGLDAAGVQAFVEAPDPARVLPDTAWLDDAYADSHLLARADDRSYRFVISSVLGLTPELFTTIDGFDESFVGYGGEDWDLGNRAWLAGADLAHRPDAVAWHDGPDAGGRDADALAAGTPERDLVAAKNVETLRVARVVTEPGARDARLTWDVPDVAITVDDRGLPAADVLLTCADLVAGTDARVWLTDGAILRDGLWPGSDPRVVAGPLPARVRARARFVVAVDHPVRLTTPLADLLHDAPWVAPGIRVDRTRDLARGATRAVPADALERVRATLRSPRPDGRLEAEWGWRRADSLAPLPLTPSEDDDDHA